MAIEYNKLEDAKLFLNVKKEYMKKYLKEHAGFLPSQSTIDERDEIIFKEYLKRLAEQKKQTTT